MQDKLLFSISFYNPDEIRLFLNGGLQFVFQFASVFDRNAQIFLRQWSSNAVMFSLRILSYSFANWFLTFLETVIALSLFFFTFS
jgi:hypothetical protein